MMKTITKLLSFGLILLMVGFAAGGCNKYDDSALWGEIDNLKSNVAKLNTSVNSLKTVVEALEAGKVITEVKTTADGYTIKFNDGKSIEITNGKDGAQAPVVGVKELDGTYYWTVTTGGTTEFIYDNSSPKNKLPVSGADGVTPALTVDTEGYWVINGKRLVDANNQPVKAVGSNGDSLFKNVTQSSTEVVFTLADGSTITIPKLNNAFSFALAQGETFVAFKFGETKQVALNLTDITNIELLKASNNWSVTLDIAKKLAVITAPSAGNESYADGVVSLIGIDKKGNTLLASLSTCVSIDYTDKDGTFVVCEGNMTSVNGTVTYYNAAGKEFKKVFEMANNGLEIGNVCQDIYMANGRIYIITQNGSNMKGAGRFVVCDAKTMKMIYADPLEIKTPTAKATWPQHIVVLDNKTAYIQYSEAGAEATSGICKLTLADKSVTIGATIEGTYGAFTTNGATKTRMVLSRGKIYAGAGQKVVIINPTNNTVEKTIPFPGRQVKGIVKAVDNNLYITLAGTYTGASPSSGTLTSDPKIVSIDHNGDIITEQDLAGIKFPIATWSPAVSMCASFTDPYIYFTDSNDFAAVTASRYNYQTKTLDKNYIAGNETIYGIMGQHPTTKKLWVATSTYVTSTIYLYDVSAATSTRQEQFEYPSQSEASPASIDFAYRFTTEYLNK